MESRIHGPSIEVDAPYVAEMVRNDLQAKYGDAIYTAGYQVFTTIDSRLEAAATVALRTGLLEYDRRHGWRGATDKVDLSKGASDAELEAELEDRPAVGGLRPAIVESVEEKSAKIYVKDMGSVTLPWAKMSWARRELPEEKTDRSPIQASEIFSRGRCNLYRRQQPADAAVRAGSRGAERPRRNGPEGRRGSRAGRGLRLFPEQIQSSDTGAAPARLGIQAVRLCRGIRQGLHAGERRDRCAGGHRHGGQRCRVAAEGDGGRVLRSGAPARGARPFAQSRLGAPRARHRCRIHARLCDALRLRQEHTCPTI